NAKETPSEPRLSEDGIAQALRQMENAGPDPPTKISQALPDLTPRMPHVDLVETEPELVVGPGPALVMTDDSVSPRDGEKATKDTGAWNRFPLSDQTSNAPAAD